MSAENPQLTLQAVLNTFPELWPWNLVAAIVIFVGAMFVDCTDEDHPWAVTAMLAPAGLYALAVLGVAMNWKLDYAPGNMVSPLLAWVAAFIFAWWLAAVPPMMLGLLSGWLLFGRSGQDKQEQTKTA